MNRFLPLCCLSIWALCLFLARVNFVEAEAEAAKSVDGGDNDEISDFLIEENPDYFSDNDSGSDSDSDSDGDNYDEEDDENDKNENEDTKSKVSKALNKTKKTTNAIKVLKKNRTTITLALVVFAFRNEIFSLIKKMMVRRTLTITDLSLIHI